MSIGQLVLVRVGVKELSAEDYAHFIRYVSLSLVVTLIFGAPAMSLRILGVGGHETLTSANRLLNYVVVLAVSISIAVAIVAMFQKQWVLLRSVLFVTSIVLTTSYSSAQRGELAAHEEWGSVFKLLTAEGCLKLGMVLIVEQIPIGIGLPLFMVLLVLPQAMASAMFIGRFRANVLKIGKYNQNPVSVQSVERLLSIWISGSGSVLATFIPIWLATKSKAVASDDVKTLATSLWVFRAPMSFSSAVITPFVIEESKHFRDTSQMTDWNRIRTHLKISLPKFVSGIFVYGLLVTGLLVTMFGFSLKEVSPLAVLISASTLLYFVGEVISSFMQSQNKFLHSIIGWGIATLVLWILFEMHDFTAIAAGVIMTFSATVLVLTHCLIIAYSDLVQ